MTRWSCCRTAGVNSSSSTTFSGRWCTPRKAPSCWSQASRWVGKIKSSLPFSPLLSLSLSWSKTLSTVHHLLLRGTTVKRVNISLKALLICQPHRSHLFIKNRLWLWIKTNVTSKINLACFSFFFFTLSKNNAGRVVLRCAGGTSVSSGQRKKKTNMWTAFGEADAWGPHHGSKS